MTRRQTAVLVAAALLSGACGTLEPAAATVRGRPIDVDVLEDALEVYVASERFEGDAQGPEGAGTAKRSFQQEILSVLIRRRVLRPVAADMGIEVTDAELEDFIAERFGGADAFEERASDGGFDAPFLSELIRDELLAEKLGDEITRDVVAAPENARAFYDENPDDFVENHIQEIRVARNDDAIEVSNRLRNADESEIDALFARLAERYSADPASAAQAGDRGFVRTSELPPDLAQVIERLRPGDISPPIRSEAGLHIIRLVERRAVPFGQARGEIQTQLTQRLKERTFREWASEAYREADVDVHSRFGEFDLGTFSVVDATQGRVPGTGSPSPTPAEGPGGFAPPG